MWQQPGKTIERLISKKCKDFFLFSVYHKLPQIFRLNLHLSEEYPQIHKHLQEEKCLVKTNARYFKSVARHIKLPQSRVFDILKGEMH